MFLPVAVVEGPRTNVFEYPKPEYPVEVQENISKVKTPKEGSF